MNELIKQINKLSFEADKVHGHELTAEEVSFAIANLVASFWLKDDKEDEKLDEWMREIREFRCKIIGSCHWEYDQCGYWGHQYCVGCHKPKYPELNKLRCSDAKKRIGDIKEEEYCSGFGDGTENRLLTDMS